MSDLDNEEIEATKMLNLIDEIKECAKNTTREDIIEVVEKLGIENEKTADEMFEELGYKTKILYTKQKIYKYINNYWVIEIWYNKTICKKSRHKDTFGYVTLQELKAINKKCKELRMDLKKCKCGNIPEIREYYIKGVANRKNYFVTCTNCIYRTRSRNRRYKAIQEWNEFGAKYFCEERGLLWFDE